MSPEVEDRAQTHPLIEYGYCDGAPVAECFAGASQDIFRTPVRTIDNDRFEAVTRQLAQGALRVGADFDFDLELPQRAAQHPHGFLARAVQQCLQAHRMLPWTSWWADNPPLLATFSALWKPLAVA